MLPISTSRAAESNDSTSTIIILYEIRNQIETAARFLFGSVRNGETTKWHSGGLRIILSILSQPGQARDSMQGFKKDAMLSDFMVPGTHRPI